jgi:hypothetical protein
MKSFLKQLLYIQMLTFSFLPLKTYDLAKPRFLDSMLEVLDNATILKTRNRHFKTLWQYNGYLPPFELDCQLESTQTASEFFFFNSFEYVLQSSASSFSSQILNNS